MFWILLLSKYCEELKAVIETDKSNIIVQYQLYAKEKEKEQMQKKAEKAEEESRKKDELLQDHKQKADKATKELEKRDLAAKQLQNENAKLKEQVEGQIKENEKELIRLREKVSNIYKAVFKANLIRVMFNLYTFAKTCQFSVDITCCLKAPTHRLPEAHYNKIDAEAHVSLVNCVYYNSKKINYIMVSFKMQWNLIERVFWLRKI